ncbi:MAG: glycosyltransferase [candidate division WS6 bacterium GW2011_GWC1_33_20]|uniref:Glycosyltransferase n=2 Tax=Candidatus Dojkabacteria TaxID=74243 RepID=A0A0G0DHP6_9BACT|nr:MAG: glycosyltransferase [candidate division WS6 bacterium GW2011_GWC1_33_20]KKP44763.1 MAG: glycosyltransferase [candidate division WS6 bacterium GW2011_GWF1_33_233]KKP54330.1 MAG: glycosyltransferase [candidate division WS6 bacterium GW2011_WS6_33_547]KKP54877.1 MAG: Glycosyltransferase [candidate division WS6 bacterium GW2011_GWB1_33_6]HBB64538.1 glycosyltransferase WbuB [Patescibacteria group bacterium]
MKKNVLVICQHYWPENFRITDFCQGLIEKGYNVDILCGIPNYPKGEFYKGYSYWKPKQERHNGVRIFRTIEIPRKGNTTLRIFLNYISFPISSTLLIPRFLLSNNKYDHIFIYQLSPVLMGISGIILGKLKNIKTTIYVLDLWPDNLYSVLTVRNKYLRIFLYKISTWFYKNADNIIAISPEMEKVLRERTGKKQENMTTVYQYCEKLYEGKPRNNNLRKIFNKKFKVVFTGNITPAQTPETIIRTAILLKQNGYEKKILFIIVGGGMSIENFISDVKNKNLQEMFHFEGIKPVEEIPKYYDIADALLVTMAQNELLNLTIPAKVTSYIASGKPILASIGGAGARLLEEIGNSLISQPEDHNALYQNIIKIFQMTQQERRAVGEKSYAYYYKYLERNKSIDRILKFIQI